MLNEWKFKKSSSFHCLGKVVVPAAKVGGSGPNMTGYLSRKHTMEGSHKKASQR